MRDSDWIIAVTRYDGTQVSLKWNLQLQIPDDVKEMMKNREVFEIKLQRMSE